MYDINKIFSFNCHIKSQMWRFMHFRDRMTRLAFLQKEVFRNDSVRQLCCLWYGVKREGWPLSLLVLSFWFGHGLFFSDCSSVRLCSGLSNWFDLLVFYFIFMSSVWYSKSSEMCFYFFNVLILRRWQLLSIPKNWEVVKYERKSCFAISVVSICFLYVLF